MPQAVVAQPAPYPVGRPRGVCGGTGRTIEPGDAYVAGLRETDAGTLERVEYLPDAWDAADREGLIAHWHTTMPAPDAAKRKLLVDDGVLVELFRRLGDVDGGDDRLAFRFVLGLVLMRKKLLNFERAEDGVWFMRLRKSLDPQQEEIAVLDPKLDESRLDEVGRQVGRILNDGIDADALDDAAPGDGGPA